MLQQEQALVKIGCIEYGENTVERIQSSHASQDHVYNDLLFERMSAQRMCSGKINQLSLCTIKFERANVALDSHTGIIAYSLSEAGQSIEQRALAGIRITDHSNTRLHAASYRYLMGRNTNFRGFSHQPLWV